MRIGDLEHHGDFFIERSEIPGREDDCIQIWRVGRTIDGRKKYSDDILPTSYEAALAWIEAENEKN